jgi:hypothetical protein
VGGVVAGREVACCCQRRCGQQGPEVGDAHGESAGGCYEWAGASMCCPLAMLRDVAKDAQVGGAATEVCWRWSS